MHFTSALTFGSVAYLAKTWWLAHTNRVRERMPHRTCEAADRRSTVHWGERQRRSRSLDRCVHGAQYHC